jgi:hypothetical protein
MKKILIYATGVVLGAAMTATAQTADEIVDKANRASYYAGDDGRADVTMTITDAQGGTRTREFRILRKNTEDGNQKFYVYFQAPADVRRMAYLVWKNTGEGQDDDRWLWMPALNLVRRIAPGDKRTSFVGSDFTYEDVSGRNPRADSHELTETTDTQYVIRNVPKDPGSVEFAEYTVWIDKDTFLPRKAEYRDKQGVLYRTVEATRVETVEGIPTVTESVVKDVVSGSRTENAFRNVAYNLGLDERLFAERFLRRPPREVME